ncbi:MAG: penicillin-binding transpeptidase domain-containing protein, partial [Fibrobacter sp.]|nr:penicillin-binding transpeptidase domain-containing protein [Fibrobacter sp.]
KTITAAAAIEEARLSSKSMLKQVGRNHTLYKFQLVEELKDYRELTLEEAYARSINPVFARIGIYQLKPGALVEYGKRFGFDQKIPFELPVEIGSVQSPDSMLAVAELASGFNRETTLSPLLGALIASGVSEGGRMPVPILVDSVMRGDSCIYKASEKTWRTPVKESTSAELRELMSSVSRYGTARKSFNYIRQTSSLKDFQYGGKTGSVNKDDLGKIDWFIGFARNPSNPQERVAAGVVTIHGEYWTVHSSFIAAELFRNYLRKLQKDKERQENEKVTVSID